MKRTTAVSLTLLPMAGVLTLFLVASRGASSRAGAAAPAQTPLDVVAAPGRVEPRSEEIKVGAPLNGKLHEVPVEEGDRVARGQVIAVLENDDYRARVALAEAQLAESRAQLRRVLNGARRQERQEALAAVNEASAELENARLEIERRETGYRQGVFSREEADRARRAFGVAQARHDAAVERHALIEDDPREEDRAKAEADVALAQAQLAEARALFEKTIVRAPVSGIVLRKHLKAGESFSDMRDTPIVTMGDTAALRVRVDVDETDVGKVRLGQRGYVTADAYSGRKFWGRVLRVGQLLGKKNVRTDQPSERVDNKILEVLLELDDGHELPAGLRVDAFLVAAGTDQDGRR